MSAFQFVNPAPLFFNIPGTAPIGTGGNLHFYDEGTTNPRDTWSDPDLDISHLNPNPVPLDASGRSTVAIWLDGDYTVVLRDSLGDLVWSRPVRSDVIAGLSIPTLVADYIMSNDGSNLAWIDPIGALFPDPAGSAGYILGTDGSNIFWTPQQEIPEPAEPDIVVDDTANTFQAGVSDDTTKYFVQTGAGSAPASGSQNTSVSVVFPTAFTELWHVSVTQKHNGVTANSSVPSQSNTTESATGFTVRFSTNENSANSEWNIINSVPFSWMAVGTRTVAP